ncbi:MAG TPA: YicC/YloC family endoribonuclease [Gemmatimonadaceae bacterium]|nr:YicC/YloC family endoribonuclease [Gemmatimonadaceae bacterium]
MIRSMTGFGASEGAVGGARVSVELRTVNHRFFSPSLKLPSALARWEPEVREALRRRIARGHVTVTARIERPAESGAVLDEGKFSFYATALRSLRDRHGLGGEVDVATVLRMPDVVRADAEDIVQGSADPFVALVETATDALTAMREAEGARLARVLLDRLAVVEDALRRIAERAPERVVAQRDRLRENVQQLAEGVALDEQRLAQEIAILADRLDVGEELDRFRAHVAAFRDTLASPGAAPVGKRLGFLLQEMLREANTAGSKANDASMQRDVVVVKEELERIREQVENLE